MSIHEDQFYLELNYENISLKGLIEILDIFGKNSNSLCDEDIYQLSGEIIDHLTHHTIQSIMSNNLSLDILKLIKRLYYIIENIPGTETQLEDLRLLGKKFSTYSKGVRYVDKLLSKTDSIPVQNIMKKCKKKQGFD